ncbi:MAG: oligosaccharide flippase family protein [Eubacterium sp.]|nr:oligosaccharide flippase family protein [Eubacterium sp.]
MNQRKAGALLSYLYLALTFAVGIFYTPILLGFLGESEYGVYSVANSAIAFLAILDLGFSQTMIRYVSRCKALKDKVGEQKLNGMFLLLYSGIAVIALIAGTVLFFNLDLVFQRGFTPAETAQLKIIFVILLINLVVSFPLGIYSSIISANEGFFYLKLVNIISFALTHAGILLALFLGYKSVMMAVITTVVSIALKLITAVYGTSRYRIRFMFRGFDRALLREVFVFSFFIFLNIVIDQLYSNTDKFILGALCSSAMVTTYTVGVQFYSYFEQFSTSISGVFLPKITQLVTVNDNLEEVSALFCRIGRVQFILLGFLMSGFIIFGRQFISLWVGKDQMDAYGIALVVILPALIPLSQNLGISVLRALNQHRFRSIIYFFIALVNVGLSIPLALRFGGFGAACATGFATCCGQIATMNWFYYKKIGLDIPGYWKEIGKIVLPLLPVTAAGAGIHWLMPAGGWILLLAQCVLYTGIFLVFGWLMIFNQYEKELLTGLFKKWRKK